MRIASGLAPVCDSQVPSPTPAKLELLGLGRPAVYVKSFESALNFALFSDVPRLQCAAC